MLWWLIKCIIIQSNEVKYDWNTMYNYTHRVFKFIFHFKHVYSLNRHQHIIQLFNFVHDCTNCYNLNKTKPQNWPTLIIHYIKYGLAYNLWDCYTNRGLVYAYKGQFSLYRYIIKYVLIEGWKGRVIYCCPIHALMIKATHTWMTSWVTESAYCHISYNLHKLYIIMTIVKSIYNTQTYTT